MITNTANSGENNNVFAKKHLETFQNMLAASYMHAQKMVFELLPPLALQSNNGNVNVAGVTRISLKV